MSGNGIKKTIYGIFKSGPLPISLSSLVAPDEERSHLAYRHLMQVVPPLHYVLYILIDKSAEKTSQESGMLLSSTSHTACSPHRQAAVVRVSQKDCGEGEAALYIACGYDVSLNFLRNKTSRLQRK